MKKLFLAISVFIIVLFLGRNLNPLSPTMFTFHDSTQPARIQQFTLNLKQLNIPPRVAPDLNFGIGYPVFNFYAPFSYWLTSIFNLIGFDITFSLKLSFLLALAVGFLGCYLFLKNFFDFLPSLTGGILYITSLYFPLNIFVRGNLAEVWFLALFPLTLFFIYKNSLKNDKKIFILTSIFFSFLLTSHNILSLVSLPFTLVFLLLLKNKKQNLLSFFIALLLSIYFWLPAIAEMEYTWAREVATLTNYQDHFLCPGQLWQSQWGFGGSTPGCINDGMSFMIGKIQLMLFGLGAITFLISLKKARKKINSATWFFLFLTLFHLFLTTYQSRFLWELFFPISSIIQFPWRLLGPPLLGIVYFSAYFLDIIKIPLKNFLIFTLLIVILAVNGKYFKGQEISKKSFENKFLSQTYIEKRAAYAVAEYLPKTIDYQYWRSLEKKNNIPMEYYARSSIVPFSKDKQTPVEIAGNIISLIGLSVLLWTTLRKKQLFRH